MAVTTAAALTAASIAASAGGAAMSFKQANDFNRKMKDAERAADKALSEAKGELDKNFYEQLTINNEAYELEGDILMSSAAAAIDAARESDLGAGASAGRIQIQQQKAARDRAVRMAGEVDKIQRLKAGEDARLAGERSRIDLAEAEGAGVAQREYENARSKSISQGLNQVGNAAKIGLEQLPLYFGSGGSQDGSVTGVNSLNAPTNGQIDFSNQSSLLFDQDMAQVENLDYGMTPEERRVLEKWMNIVSKTGL